MADIVNLRSARKAKARLAAERHADANRAKHGRTKVQAEAEERERKRRERELDDVRREPDG